MKTTIFDRIATIVSILIMLAATVFLMINWGNLPEQVPSHYDFKGEPDDYGGNGILIFTLVMGWVMVLTFVVIGLFPQIWNTGVERTPANEAVINRIVKDMMNLMEVGLACMFAYMTVVPVLGINMGSWFMPLFLVIIFGTIIFTVVRLIRNR